MESWGRFAEIAERTAKELRSLYSFSADDVPDKPLGFYPNPGRVIEALKILIDVLLPGRFSSGVSSREQLLPFISERLVYVSETLGPEIELAIPLRWLGDSARREGIEPEGSARVLAEDVLEKFFAAIPKTRQMLVGDIEAAYADPAALSYAEVKVAYPGILAIASHRLANTLYRLRVPIIPRLMSEWTHTQTGADIHPGATIGERFFVDHGTGVVIGETAIIGNGVTVYQGATLGARSMALDEFGQPMKHVKRHPTVEDGVVIFANAVILGGDTVIGRGATIGGGVCVMESVPAGSTVLGNRPELRIRPPR